MRLSCTVCYEHFIPTEDVRSAPCGHKLHYRCWAELLARSQNCPDCRKQTCLHDLFKLFFNVGEGDDYSTLSNKFDALRCDLSCKTKECEEAEKKLSAQNKEIIQLQQEVQKLKTENEELRKKPSKALIKSKAEADKAIERKNKVLSEEVINLRKKVQELKMEKKALYFKNIHEAQVKMWRSSESIVLNLQNSLHEYKDMKKNHEFLESLKAYTDQVPFDTNLWDHVDDDPAKFVTLMKDVKRFFYQKEHREMELRSCPRGCVLEVYDIPKSANLTWRIIRDCVEAYGVQVAFVTYNPGDTEALVRLEESPFMESPAIKIADQVQLSRSYLPRLGPVHFRALDGQEETDFLRSSLEARDERNRKRLRRRKGYQDRDLEESLFDWCMRLVEERKKKNTVFLIEYCP